MTTLKLDFGKEIKTFNIPTSWDDITVETYCKFLDLDKEESRARRIVNNICLFTGLTDREYFQIPTTERDQILECFNFLNESIEPSNVKSIKVGNEEYFCYFDFNKILTGEEFTIQVLSDRANGNMLKLLPEVLCLLLRKKIDGKFETYDIDWLESDRVEKFKNLKIVDVLQVINSFTNTEKE